jgi:alanyl aminopeptidase
LPRPGDEEDVRLLRSQVVGTVAEDGEDAGLRVEAARLTRAWLKDHKAVDPDVIGGVLGAAAHAGDAALFSELRAAAKVEKERRDRRRLLQALGSFTDPALAKRALELVLSDEFDARESFSILGNLSGEPATRGLAWDFVRQGFATLEKRLPPETVAELPFVPTAFCDETHRAEAAAFFRDRSAKLPGGPRALEQALESMSLCSAYVHAQQASATTFLKKY